MRLIGQHLCDVGLRTSADVLMREAGCRLDQPTAATFRHCVMKVIIIIIIKITRTIIIKYKG